MHLSPSWPGVLCDGARLGGSTGAAAKAEMPVAGNKAQQRRGEFMAQVYSRVQSKEQ